MSDCIPCGCRDSLPTKELGIEEWKDEYLKLVIYASAVSRENAKLRELVQKMMRFMEDGDWCTKCEVERECDAQQYEGDCLMRGVFRNSMRELGVEV